MIVADAGNAQIPPALRGVGARIELPVEVYGRLRAKPNQELNAPLVVRVLEQPGGLQVAEFVGTIPGTYDLLAFLERADGRVLADAPAREVVIVSTLPAEGAVDLAGAATAPPSVGGLPMTLIIIVAALWLMLPVAVFLSRRKQPPKAAPVEVRVRTLMEEIAALGAASSEGTLSTAEKGRLELLLIRFCRERLREEPRRDGLDALGLPPNAGEADIIRALRQHPQTRELVQAMEAWLHRAPATDEERRADAQRASGELERFLRHELERASAPMSTSTGGAA